MPNVKIVAKGFEGYNGVIEGVQFVNGLSTEPLSQFSAERIGAFMRVVDADTDAPLGVGQRMVDARRSNHAPSEPLQRVKRTPTGKKKEVTSRKTISYDFTREQLEKVADEGGINGLRKVADQYEVRGRSIREIIEALMAIKANEEAKKNAQTPAQKAQDEEPASEPDTASVSSDATGTTDATGADIDKLIGE